MMKTITYPIGYRRSIPYCLGLVMLFFSLIFPAKTFSQTCLEHAQAQCDEDEIILIELNGSDDLTITFADFLTDAGTCSEADFEISIRQLLGGGVDSLLDNTGSTPGTFTATEACRYVGERLRAKLIYLDGDNRTEVCEKRVVVIPQITATKGSFYCNHPVFESNQDPDILPLQYSCEDFDDAVFSPEIINQFWENTDQMDTLFRIWEVSVNNVENVFTFTDTILREAIPTDLIQFPDTAIVSCDDWDGTAPDPALSGVPYFIIDQDTVYLDAEQVMHCINVLYNDKPYGPFECEIELYEREWTIRFNGDKITGTQMILVKDQTGPTGAFQGLPADSMDYITGGNTLTIPVYNISSGGQGCRSDGVLPVINATDNCAGVYSINVSAEIDGTTQTFTNGGPFMGFDQGTYILKYTLSDSCWNQSEYYTAVRVTDNVNPVVALSTKYNISLSGSPVTWLRTQDFAAHHITDNCGLEFVVARRVGDHATACGADDPDSETSIYQEYFKEWLKTNYPGDCDHLIEADEGWSDRVPFCCEDIGQEIEIEVLAIDQSCNVTRGRTILVPLDQGAVIVSKYLQDVNISCEAWSEHYADVILSGGNSGNPDLDSLDKYFGTYIAGSGNSNTGFVTIQDYNCSITQGEQVLDPVSFDIQNGMIDAVCAGDLTQEAELVEDDDCNTFTIIRRFLVNGFEMGTQRITTEVRCPFTTDLFEFPDRVDTSFTISSAAALRNQANWTGNMFNVTTNGPEYIGAADCRLVGIGYVDKLLEYVNGSNNQAVGLIQRTWCMADWCTSDIGNDWASSIGNNGVLIWTQKIKFFVDEDNPDVPLKKSGNDEGITDNPTEVRKAFDISGKIRTEDALNVQNVSVDLVASGQSELQITNESGSYRMEVKEGDRVQIIPDKKDHIGNGLSTMDLILIQRHLLGKQIINSPYKLIAADANNDQKLTPADVLFLRKIILGQTKDLNVETSWKFVDANYAFVNKREAFAENYPTIKDISYVNRDFTGDFIAVKLGDVNQSVNVTRSAARSAREMKFLSVEDRHLQAGEVMTIPVRMTEDLAVQGMQFALNYPADALEILNIESNAVNLKAEEYAMDDGQIRLSWFNLNGENLQEGEAFLTLEVRAKAGISLRDALSILPLDVEPEIYDTADGIYNVGLKFDKNTGVFEVLQNRPNPVQGETVIPFMTDRMRDVTLSIHDVNGKLIYSDELRQAEGQNEFRVNTGRLNAGVLYYSVTDGTESITRKMVVIK